MFAAKPIVAVRDYEQDTGYLAFIRQRVELLMEHKGIVADHQKLKDVQELFKEQANVWIADVDAILRMYPEANTKLALSGLDTEVTGLVLDAFAHFFIGTSWPTSGDQLNSGQLFTWNDVFRRQVIKTGLGEAV